MVRLELFANRSVEDAIMDQLQVIGCHYFTKIPMAYGEGTQDPKQGDAIWPEINFILIIYCKPEDVTMISIAIRAVKNKFPKEGIKLFKMHAEDI